MNRVLFRPRWIVLHIIMLVAMPLFATAGFWQLRRLDEKQTKNELIEKRMAMPPMTNLAGDNLDFGLGEFRRARVTGTYVEDEKVILTGRPHQGRSGDHILMPLHTSWGDFIVDRGWVPVGETNVETPDEVTVEGFLLPSEGRAPFTSGRGATSRITRIDLDRLGSNKGVYLLLRKQEPSQELPIPGALAPLTEGSHGSYAVQWFLFIPTAIVVYVLVLRRATRSGPD